MSKLRIFEVSPPSKLECNATNPSTAMVLVLVKGQSKHLLKTQVHFPIPDFFALDIACRTGNFLNGVVLAFNSTFRSLLGLAKCPNREVHSKHRTSQASTFVACRVILLDLDAVSCHPDIRYFTIDCKPRGAQR